MPLRALRSFNGLTNEMVEEIVNAIRGALS